MDVSVGLAFGDGDFSQQLQDVRKTMAKRIFVGLGAMLLILLAVRAFAPGLLPAPFSGLIPEERAFEPPADSAAGMGASSHGVWETLEGVEPAQLFPALSERARLRAERPWQPPSSSLATQLANLDYDGYRQVAYRPDAALWRGESSFEIQFFHLGGAYLRPVRMVEMGENGASVIPFLPEQFRYPGEADASQGAVPLSGRPELGDLHDFAGFRVHFPLNRPGVADEVVVFQGASYFRLLGPGQVHGLSGRGLAVNTPLESGEEFPDFRQFWLVRPDSGQRQLTFYALLDGPSVTGAYRFVLEPGSAGDFAQPSPTVLEVEARLFARRDVQRLGVAPLTSMFLHSPAAPHGFDDLRPRVHDSQGLLMASGEGEWIWRPLSNRFGFQVTSIRDAQPQGFGLVQRNRDFGEYLDLEAQYHLRPSIWVELLEGDWETGGVELVEIPTASEFFDNIVAYWVPDTPFSQGDERRFTYRLHTFHGPRWGPSLGLPEAWVKRTVQGRASLPGEANPLPGSHRRFVVDFHLASETVRAADTNPPEMAFQASSGEASDLQVVPLPQEEGWRATFRLAPHGTTPVDMRLHLHRNGRRVSETWSYLWVPQPTSP